MEIDFPIEFLVYGTPVSSQAKMQPARDMWKERVRQASDSTIPRPHFASQNRIAVTLYYFPPDVMQGDIDNIAKLILDALSRHIYVDDGQVERLVVQKFEPGSTFDFAQPSETMAQAIAAERPVLFVRVSSNPFEELK